MFDLTSTTDIKEEVEDVTGTNKNKQKDTLRKNIFKNNNINAGGRLFSFMNLITIHYYKLLIFSIYFILSFNEYQDIFVLCLVLALYDFVNLKTRLSTKS